MPRTWQDRIVQYPGRFTIVNNGDGTSTLTPSPGTVTQVGTTVNAAMLNGIESDLADMTNHTTLKSNKDANGISTAVQLKRADGTLYMKSVLSNGISPNYATRTETYYLTDGVTIDKTKIYSRTYDADGDLASEVIS